MQDSHVRILLVDDQPTVRQGLRMLLALEPDLEVIGEADDGFEAIALAGELKPDVVVMDVQMPGMDGISATKTLSNSSPVPVVVLTVNDNVFVRARAMQAGAAEFVSKYAPAGDLLASIRRAGTKRLAPALPL